MVLYMSYGDARFWVPDIGGKHSETGFDFGAFFDRPGGLL